MVLLPLSAHVVLLGVALLLGTLSLLLSVVAAVRGHGRRVLTVGAVAVGGPVIVLVGGNVLPHVLNPCAVAEVVGVQLPAFCVRTPEGADVPENWHALDHALVGFLPLSLALAWWWKRRMSIRHAPSGS